MSESLKDVVLEWEMDADPEFVAIVNKAIERGDVEWQWDPMVDGVVGLVPARSCSTFAHDNQVAYVVIYADGDWESTDDAEVLLQVGYGSIYRLVMSPTTHEYLARGSHGEVRHYGTMKQATRYHGDLPLVVIK